MTPERTYNPVEIGPRIKEARKAKKLSQDKLGGMVGLSGATISSMERGAYRQREAFVRAVAEAMGVTFNWLAYGIPPTTVEEKEELVAAIQDATPEPARSPTTRVNGSGIPFAQRALIQVLEDRVFDTRDVEDCYLLLMDGTRP